MRLDGWPSLAVACAATALEASTSRAQTVPDIRIVEFGEYVVDREHGPVEPQFNPVGTVIETGAFHFVSRTAVIEARLCHRFGIKYIAPNLDPVRTERVTIRARHPRITDPDGVAADEETWDSPINGRASNSAGYTFGDPWRLAPGRWTFTVLYAGVVLAEQAFEVVASPKPGAMPPGGCNAPIS